MSENPQTFGPAWALTTLELGQTRLFLLKLYIHLHYRAGRRLAKGDKLGDRW
jgi:hypothetical protein